MRLDSKRRRWEQTEAEVRDGGKRGPADLAEAYVRLARVDERDLGL